MMGTTGREELAALAPRALKAHARQCGVTEAQLGEILFADDDFLDAKDALIALICRHAGGARQLVEFAGLTLTPMRESELLAAGGVGYAEGFVCDACDCAFYPGGGWTVFHGDGSHIRLDHIPTLLSGWWTSWTGGSAGLDLCESCAAQPKAAERRFANAQAEARGPRPGPRPRPRPSARVRFKPSRARAKVRSFTDVRPGLKVWRFSMSISRLTRVRVADAVRALGADRLSECLR